MRVNSLLDKNNEIDASFLKHLLQDPVLNKRQRRILEFHFTKVHYKLSNKEKLDKIATYFGYKKKAVLQDLIYIEDHQEGIFDRAREKTLAEYETIEKEPSPA